MRVRVTLQESDVSQEPRAVAPGNEDDIFHLFDPRPKSPRKSEPDLDMLDYPLAKIPSRHRVLASDRCWKE
jgi:hypothetical protein